MVTTIADMTTREQVLKLVEELPESRLEPLIEFLKSQDRSGDTVDDGERVATPEEFASFETEFGPFLPPDGEG
jgi:hypothetical protein